MGGYYVPDDGDPRLPAAGTDLAPATERVRHILELAPEICTLDCGTMNVCEFAYLATLKQLRVMAGLIRDSGVRPEIEVFELGHIWVAKKLIAEGLIKSPALFQLCMGVPYGAPADPECMLAMRNQLPQGSIWSGFSVGAQQFPFAAQAMIMGGNIRVGLEDNLYLRKGVLADNRQLVEKAVQLVELLGGSVAAPGRAREILGLAG